MSEKPEALRLADEFRKLIIAFGMTERGNVAAAERELRRLHALCVEQIKLIERVNCLCADIVRTNSKDTRDWLEDVAFISSITAGHLAKWKESK